MPVLKEDHAPSSTHYACFEKMAEGGGNAGCCGCSGHVCQRDRMAAELFNNSLTTSYTRMPYTIEEIRELRKGITAAPWRLPKVGENEKRDDFVFIYGQNDEAVCNTCCCGGLMDGDAEFIAAAPAIIDQLLAERAAMRKGLELMRKEAEGLEETWKEYSEGACAALDDVVSLLDYQDTGWFSRSNKFFEASEELIKMLRNGPPPSDLLIYPKDLPLSHGWGTASAKDFE